MYDPPVNPLDTHAVAPAPEPTPARTLDPVRGGERIGSIDVLRGVALLGILVMNAYAFALPWPAYTNPLLAGGDGALDQATWWATHLLAEMKFMTIFSMLFGAGLALMAEPGGGSRRTLLRRSTTAACSGWRLIGLVHAYLMWFGDILFWYAICGVALYPIRRLRPILLIPAGLILILVTVPLTLGFGWLVLPTMEHQAQEALEAERAGEELDENEQAALEGWSQFHPGPEELEQEAEIYRGGYLEQVAFRAPLVLQFQVFALFFFGWRIVGTMVLGLGLMKLGVFAAACSSRTYVAFCLLGYGIGLPMVYLGARGLQGAAFDPLYMNQGGIMPNYIGSLFVAMGHVGVVMLVYKSGVLQALTRRLAAVGRMALTHYLAHTVIFTTLFYGWGFGFYGSLGRFQLMGVVLAVWLVQLIVSPLWLSRFRFGPAEWLWRCLTYWRRQPMRIERTNG